MDSNFTNIGGQFESSEDLKKSESGKCSLSGPCQEADIEASERKTNKTQNIGISSDQPIPSEPKKQETDKIANYSFNSAEVRKPTYMEWEGGLQSF